MGRSPAKKRCFLRNPKRKSHCWSLILFWVHLQCLKFQRVGHFVDTVVVVVVVVDAIVVVVVVVDEIVVVGIRVSRRQVSGIYLELRLSL